MGTERSPLLAVLLVAAGVVWASRRLRRYEVAEHSMAPTLLPGDYVVAIRSRRAPMRGDVIVFPHPSRHGFELVKRVVALPGEHVAIRSGRTYIDDAALPEPWAAAPTRPDGEWLLGAGELFVLGDARALSAEDSRDIGPVSLAGAAWVVTCRYWPRQRIGLL